MTLALRFFFASLFLSSTAWSFQLQQSFLLTTDDCLPYLNENNFTANLGVNPKWQLGEIILVQSTAQYLMLFPAHHSSYDKKVIYQIDSDNQYLNNGGTFSRANLVISLDSANNMNINVDNGRAVCLLSAVSGQACDEFSLESSEQ